MSGSYERDSVAVHFTWVRDQSAIAGVLPLIESVLLPLGARPHWGKCFAAEAEQLGHAFRRLADFSTLCVSADPAGKFSNRFLDVRLPRPGRNKT